MIWLEAEPFVLAIQPLAGWSMRKRSCAGLQSSLALKTGRSAGEVSRLEHLSGTQTVPLSPRALTWQQTHFWATL